LKSSKFIRIFSANLKNDTPRRGEMKIRWWPRISVSVLICLWITLSSGCVTLPSVVSKQIVTDDLKSWAKEVLKEEKAIRSQSTRNTLAVLYFKNKTGHAEIDPLQKGLTLMLITDLSTLKGLQVVERVRLQALVQEMGLGPSGLIAPNTAPRVGRLLSAQWIIGGDILGRKNPPLQVLSNLLDVPTPKILGQPMAQGDLSKFFLLEKELLFEIIKLLRIEITPDQEKVLKKPCSTNTMALLLLFKGIEASDQGDYEKAIEYYGKALVEDPNICMAQSALTEVKNHFELKNMKSKGIYITGGGCGGK